MQTNQKKKTERFVQPVHQSKNDRQNRQDRQGRSCKSTKKVLFLFLVFVSAVLAAPLFAEIVEQIIVKVNNNAILTKYEIEERMQQVRAEYKSLGKKIPGNLRKEAFSELLDEILVRQMAKQEGVVIKGTEIKKRIDRILESREMTLDQFKKALKKQGTSYDAYFSQMKYRLMTQKLFQKKMQGLDQGMKPSDEEIKAYYEKNKPHQYHVHHIYIKKTGDERYAKRSAIEKTINAVLGAGGLRQPKKRPRAKKISAAKFRAMRNVARQRKVRVRDFGFLRLAPQYREVLNRNKFLSVILRGNIYAGKAISFPISGKELPKWPGYHILYVSEKSAVPLKEMRSGIENVLFEQKMNKAAESWVDSLRQDAVIEYKDKQYKKYVKG